MPLVQTVGLVAAYLLGVFYNYERLAITVCPVSCMLGKGRHTISGQLQAGAGLSEQ